MSDQETCSTCGGSGYLVLVFGFLAFYGRVLSMQNHPCSFHCSDGSAGLFDFAIEF
jgi:hypothetical protein